MKNKMRNLVNGILIFGTISLSSCARYDSSVPREYGDFAGYRIEIGINTKGIRYLKMWGAEGNRGYKPPILVARDIDPKIPGFENITLSDGRDLRRTSIEDFAKRFLENPLRRYRDPMTCERIYRSFSNRRF